MDRRHLDYNRVRSNDTSQSSEIEKNNEDESNSGPYAGTPDQLLAVVSLTRIVCFIGWIGGIAYSTYHVFLAAEERLPWQKDPLMNPGPLTGLFGRGRDTSDYEWAMFINLTSTKLIFWYGIYMCLSTVASPRSPQLSNLISTGASLLLLVQLTGFIPVVFLLTQPVLYWILLRLRSKIVTWTVTILFILGLNSVWVKILVGDMVERQYYFIVTGAWMYARCISFSFDVWNRPRNVTSSFKLLTSHIHYCFYLPLCTTGPLVLFDHFEEHMINKRTTHNLNARVGRLFFGIFRMILVTILNEFIIHFLYFRPLALSPADMKDLNLWALCGVVYWLGQFFMLKYKVMYGVPSLVAEYEGMPMPRLPRCPAYLHRYSVLWKDFDRGLYNFLIRYTYVPVLKSLEYVDTRGRINAEFRRLIASFTSFVYVYVWHSTSQEVLIWAVFNFIGITLERTGSYIKRLTDARSDPPPPPLIWDFMIEPYVTVPLAAMSIMNSAIFCGSLECARIFAVRMWTDHNDSYALVFVFFFTQVGVTIRTWESFWPLVKSRIKNKLKVS